MPNRRGAAARGVSRRASGTRPSCRLVAAFLCSGRGREPGHVAEPGRKAGHVVGPGRAATRVSAGSAAANREHRRARPPAGARGAPASAAALRRGRRRGLGRKGRHRLRRRPGHELHEALHAGGTARVVIRLGRGPGGGDVGEAGEEGGARAGGEGGEGGAEGVVAGVEAGAVLRVGRVEPAAVAEEPVAGSSVQGMSDG